MLRRIIPDVIRGQQVVYLGGQATAREAAKLMRKNNVGAVLIVEDEVLKGILTVNDMTYRVIAEGLDPDKTLLGEVMTPDPDTVSSDTTAIDALRLMQDGDYRHLPVVDGGRILGLISRRDFHGVEKARLDDETALAFTDRGRAPKKYTCEGEDISPPLSWSGTPSNSCAYEFWNSVLPAFSDIRKTGAHIGDDLPDLVICEDFLVSRHLGAELRATVGDRPQKVFVHGSLLLDHISQECR